MRTMHSDSDRFALPVEFHAEAFELLSLNQIGIMLDHVTNTDKRVYAVCCGWGSLHEKINDVVVVLADRR